MGVINSIKEALNDVWHRNTLPRAKRFLDRNRESASLSGTLFADKKILKNMYNSIKNMEIPISVDRSERGKIKTIRREILL